MNKLLTLLISFFIITPVYSQQTESKIGITLSNNYTRLEHLYRIEGEQLRPSYRIGVGFNGNFMLPKKWSFEFGFMYSSRGNDTYKKAINYGNMTNIDPSFPTHTNYSENYEFIDVPIKIFKNFNTDKKVGQFVNVGLIPSINIKYSVKRTTYYEDKKVYEYFQPENKLKNINALFHIGYGINFKLFKNISAQIELHGKRSMMNVHTKENKLQNYFWETGLSTSIYWR